MSNIVVATVCSAFLWALLPVARVGADIYVRKDSEGILHFTNVPSQSGYRMIVRERDATVPNSLRSPSHWEELIRSSSERHGVDPDLVRAVIKVESDFDARAESRKGAQGLMQLMPATADLHNVGDVYDPAENIEGGVRHLKLLLDRFRSDLRLALAAYNAGISAVEKYGGVPPFAETKEYIRRVLRYHQAYQANGARPTQRQASH